MASLRARVDEALQGDAVKNALLEARLFLLLFGLDTDMLY